VCTAPNVSKRYGMTPSLSLIVFHISLQDTSDDMLLLRPVAYLPN
jgi:hypothetical protein